MAQVVLNEVAKKVKNTYLPVAGPLARELVKKLNEQFSFAKWEVGDRIPTEHEICQQHDLSRTTVRTALSQLEDAGTINRIRGKGTFLVKRPKERNAMNGAVGKVLFMVPMDCENRHISRFSAGFHRACEKEGLVSFVCSLGSSIETEKQRLLELNSDRYLGACILPHIGNDNLDLYFDLVRKNFPFVLLDPLPGLQVDSVVHDSKQAVYLAVKHLAEQGHKKIGFMRAPIGFSAGLRYAGYIEGLGATGIVYNRDFVWQPSNEDITIHNGYKAAKDLIGLSSRPTAFIAESDEAAIGAICALRESGYKVPQDMAVIGSGGLYEPGEAIMPLSTIEMSMEAEAQEAVKLLKWRIENPNEPPKQVQLPVKLVVRQSTVGELGNTNSGLLRRTPIVGIS